jgi:HK97 gp10 family phage protein
MKYEWKGKELMRRMQDAQKTALEAAGIFIEGEAVVRCPVDTGNLRSSLTHRVKGNEVQVGTNVEYAAHVEMGTEKAKAQPYLRPAVDENKNKILRILKDCYSKIMKRGGK